jgi:hypothetical protein
MANNTLENVLTGPELASLLEGNASKNILLVVDACHSGALTSAKALNLAKPHAVPKVLRYPGMPQGDLKENLMSSGVKAKDLKQPNFGYLAACRKDEESWATKQGSFLTTALQGGWTKLHQNAQGASLQAVQPLLVKFIKDPANNPDGNQQDPELYGDPGLLQVDWFSVARPPAAPGAWSALEQISQKASGPLQASIPQTEYHKGDLMDISIVAPREGYLFVLSFGEGDAKPITLFPNDWESNNHVGPGPAKIPKAGANWHIRQGLPDGVSQQKILMVVVLSANADSLAGLLSGSGAFKEVNMRSKSPFAEEASSSTGYLAAEITYLIKQ